MKVITLLENTARKETLCRAHGLSLYLETPAHKILCDMGPNAGFLENAQALGVDIAAVDIAFLSHGHYDHAGGMELFCKRNDHAKIYLHADAFGPFYAVDGEKKVRYIGIDPAFRKYSDRFVFCRGHQVIDNELQVFSDIATHDYPTSANGSLREKVGEELRPQDFRDEQDLLITAQGKAVLVAGCAHRGIVNILRRAEELLGRAPDALFSGFHLTNPGLGVDEPETLIRAVGEELRRRPTHYYTGHCTGQGPYAILKEMLGDQITYMAGGTEFTL